MFDEPAYVWDTATFELYNMYALLREIGYDWQSLYQKMQTIRYDLLLQNKYLVVYYDAMLSPRLKRQHVLPDNHIDLCNGSPSIVPIQWADGAVVLYPNTIKVIKNRAGYGTWNNLFLKLSVREKLNEQRLENQAYRA